MRRLLFIGLLVLSFSGLAQDKKQFRDCFNEFHASVNHGIPFGGYTKTFFGGGLGMQYFDLQPFCLLNGLVDPIIRFIFMK